MNRAMNQVGDTFDRVVRLSRDDIAAFARSCGDGNPLHYDAGLAKRSRFGDIIACGPHYTSLFMGLAATHFAQSGGALGLEFTFEFRRAVIADDTLAMRWEITSLERKESLGGDLAGLSGTITNQDGVTVLTGRGKMLVHAAL